MNDRFDARLREHLLGTADTRPGDGQLASVIQGVANTGQRHPLTARLTWFPARIGPVPTRALRYGLVAVALAGTMIAGAVIVGSSAPKRTTAFEGTWTSIDPADGSEQSLVVGKGTTPSIHFVDHYATGLACRTDAVKVFTADGTGLVVGGADGARLEVTFPNGGGCGSMVVGVDFGYFDYHASTGDLVDGKRLTWTRAADAFVPPTSGPVIEPSATMQPGPTLVVEPASEACADITPGSTYRDGVGPLTLSVQIPGDAGVSWQAKGPDFRLRGFCSHAFSFAGPFIGASIVTYVDGTCELNDSTPVSSPAEVVDALSNTRGIEITGPTSATLGGYAATRFEILPNARRCFDRVPLWDGLDAGSGTAIIYVVDAGGWPLALTITDVESPNVAAEAEAIIASLQIDVAAAALPTKEPAPTADPACIQLDGSGTYTGPVGGLSVSATVPDDPATYWSGDRSSFNLYRSPCGEDSDIWLVGHLISTVAVDACKGDAGSVEVASASAAATAFENQLTTETSGRTDLAIDGHSAVRIDVTVPVSFDPSNCDDGAVMLLGQGLQGSFVYLNGDDAYTVYLVDVAGSVLAMTVVQYGGAAANPAFGAEIDAIMASLRITG